MSTVRVKLNIPSFEDIPIWSDKLGWAVVFNSTYDRDKVIALVYSEEAARKYIKHCTNYDINRYRVVEVI